MDSVASAVPTVDTNPTVIENILQHVDVDPSNSENPAKSNAQQNEISHPL